MVQAVLPNFEHLMTPEVEPSSEVEAGKLYSVNEIYDNVTIQGEGPMAGKATVFLRFQFCDGDGNGHWCSWCDTRYTWDKADVNYKFERMNANQILEKIDAAFAGWNGARRTVTISGGNPVMQLDHNLADLLISRGYDIQIETQGTMWSTVTQKCFSVVSPKPPSSGLNRLNRQQLDKWLTLSTTQVAFKVVVFDEKDYEYAEQLYNYVHPLGYPFYISSGTLVNGDAQDVVLKGYSDIINMFLQKKSMVGAIVLPQLHVLVWGRKRGV